jgi:hypothetical protein
VQSGMREDLRHSLSELERVRETDALVGPMGVAVGPKHSRHDDLRIGKLLAKDGDDGNTASFR